MKELLKELKISLSDIQNEEDLSKAFRSIADKLFEEYEIICGEKHFRFAEIEFYYYRKGCFDKEWNKITYARNEKDDGDFMYHYSGVDICFKSNYSNSNAEFGGVLIRSIYTLNARGERCMICGPLVCKDEMLNSCKGEMPKLCKSEIVIKCKDGVNCTSLAGVIEEKQREHRYYNSYIAEGEWKREIVGYDFEKECIRHYKPKYNVDKFDLKKVKAV